MDFTGSHHASGSAFPRTTLPTLGWQTHHSRPQQQQQQQQQRRRRHCHLSQLIEGKLEAGLVVGGALGFDLPHGILQHPLVADVGLHQVLEAGGVHRRVVELEGAEEGSRGVGKWKGRNLHIFLSVKYVARRETEVMQGPLNTDLNRFHFTL